MNAFRRASLALAAASCLVLIPSCDLFGDRERPAQLANLRINLTDEPTAAFESAEVSISRVYVERESARGSVLELLGPRDQPVVLDLLDLRDNVETMLAQAHVPPGRYRALHIVVDRAEITLADGALFKDGSRARTVLPDGSGPQDVSVRLTKPLVVEPGTMTLVVIDFPVGSSFAVSSTEDTTMEVEAIRFEPSLIEKRRHGVPLSR